MEYKVIVGVIFLIGIFFLLHFFYLLILSKQTKKWLSVESIIDTSEMEMMNQSIRGYEYAKRKNILCVVRNEMDRLECYHLLLVAKRNNHRQQINNKTNNHQITK